MLQQSSELYRNSLDLTQNRSPLDLGPSQYVLDFNSFNIAQPGAFPFVDPSCQGFWPHPQESNFYYVWFPNWPGLCQTYVKQDHEKKKKKKKPIPSTELVVAAAPDHRPCDENGCTSTVPAASTDLYAKYVIESPPWLPHGWITEVQFRRTGTTAGTRDKYYKDLMSGRRFRSRTEVLHFLQTGKGRIRRRQRQKAIGVPGNTGPGHPAIQPHVNLGHASKALVHSLPAHSSDFCDLAHIGSKSTSSGSSHVAPALTTNKLSKGFDASGKSLYLGQKRPAQDKLLHKLPVKKKVRFESPNKVEDGRATSKSYRWPQQPVLKLEESESQELQNRAFITDKAEGSLAIPKITDSGPEQKKRTAEREADWQKKAKTSESGRQTSAAKRRIILEKQLQEAQRSVVNMGREMQATIARLGREISAAQRTVRLSRAKAASQRTAQLSQLNKKQKANPRTVPMDREVKEAGEDTIQKCSNSQTAASRTVQPGSEAQVVQRIIPLGNELQASQSTVQLGSDMQAASAASQQHVELGSEIKVVQIQSGHEIHAFNGTIPVISTLYMPRRLLELCHVQAVQRTLELGFTLQSGHHMVHLDDWNIAQRTINFSNDEQEARMSLRPYVSQVPYPLLQFHHGIQAVHNDVSMERELQATPTTLGMAHDTKPEIQCEDSRFSFLNPKIDLTALDPGLSTRQRARAVQRMKEQYAKEMLVVLGRKLCCKLLQQDRSGYRSQRLVA